MRPFWFEDGGNASSTDCEQAKAQGEAPEDASYRAHRRPGAHLAEIFFPELTEWQSVLARLSVPLQTAVEIAVRARSDASDFQSAMLACG
ncbi:MAG TPA: hypothetical protein VGM46_09680, partial [Mesorhizobium sp.]